MKPILTERETLLRKTRNAEILRSCCMEPIGAAFRGSGLGVLVALQYFHAEDWQKGLIASAAFIGLMAGPLVVTLVARFGIRLNRAAAFVLLAASPGFVLAAASTWHQIHAWKCILHGSPRTALHWVDPMGGARQAGTLPDTSWTIFA